MNEAKALSSLDNWPLRSTNLLPDNFTAVEKSIPSNFSPIPVVSEPWLADSIKALSEALNLPNALSWNEYIWLKINILLVISPYSPFKSSKSFTWKIRQLSISSP